MTNLMGKWFISQNEENFSGVCFDSRDEAIAEGRELYDGEPFFVGKAAHPLDLVQPDIERLVEWMDECLFDHIASDDGPIVSLPDDSAAELRGIVLKFLRERGEFSRFAIVESEQITPALRRVV